MLGRDQLDPKEADYATILTKIKALNPEALYYGGVGQAGVKLAKQAYDIIPNVIKAGGDGMYSSDLLKGAGFPAVEGWYATIAAPHVTDDPKTKTGQRSSSSKLQRARPTTTRITCYVGAQVIIDAVKERRRRRARRSTATTSATRSRASSCQTPAGPIAFDDNGDLKNKIISVFQITKDDSAAARRPDAQYKYVGVAPMS